MSTVTLTIGPKNYVIACADGEEAHIAALGAVIAEKYARLGATRAPLEAQNMVFAALFLADELAEAKRQLAVAGPDRVAALEQQVAQLRLVERAAHDEIARLKTELAKARAEIEQDDLFGKAIPTANADELAQRLEQLAEQAEQIASALEAATASD